MENLDKKFIMGVVAISAVTAMAVYISGRVIETMVVMPLLAKMREKKADRGLIDG